MRCELAQRGFSDALDGETSPEHPAVVEHVASCPDCSAFATQLEELRRRLRVAALEQPPDIASAVRTELERGSSRARSGSSRPVTWEPLLRTAAVFLVAFAITATAVGLTGPRQASAVEVAQLVRTGQHRVDALAATITATEHGWHPDVPERRYEGSLAYLAPERFQLQLTDRTDYPTPQWEPNDVHVVVDHDRSWSRGSVGCPASALPACAAGARVEVVEGREPFDDGDPIALELVVPVDSFGLPAGGSAPGTVQVDGRTAVAVEVTVAQVRGLLDGITAVGTWRELHASDVVEVALDDEFGIPLSVRVRASDDAERRRWAAAHGYAEAPGATVLSWQLTDVTVNDTSGAREFAPPPAADAVTDRGFRPDDAAEVLAQPAGLTLHRAGRSGPVAVEAWSDGRAWLAIRSHDGWDRDRLFGRRGSLLVRRVTLPAGDIAYVAEGGNEVFVHGIDRDVHLRGSVTTDQLLAVAAQLDIDGQRVPGHWAEASAASLSDARAHLPGLLEPAPLPGFRGPAVRIDRDVVSLAYAGNGQRGFVLTQTPGRRLSPPMDDDVIGLSVRDAVGRFTPTTGTLEWVEDGLVVSLRSRSLSLGDLLAVAERLEAGP